jgi:hypothetical protein
MNGALTRRLAAVAGLAIAAASAAWWLGSTRLALENASDPGRSAAAALHAMWLVRALALALLAPRAGALHGWRAGAGEALALVAPCWPVLVLAWSASSAAWPQVVLAEGLLLAGAAVLPLLGQGLQRALPRAELADMAGSTIGAVLAAAVWVAAGLWAPVAP